MNRTLKTVVIGLTGLGGVASLGCHSDGEHKYGDPCWPDRYAAEARAKQVALFEPQVTNGNILDHTVWNYHFEAGTDKLNAAGKDKLDQLGRRRPAPDAVIYLQTMRDADYDAATPEAYANKRADVDSKRVLAVQKYLGATLSGRPPLTFMVQIHDPAPPGIDGAAPRVVVPSPRSRVGGGGGPGANGIGSPGATSQSGGASSALNPVSGGGTPAVAPGGNSPAPSGSAPTPGM